MWFILLLLVSFVVNLTFLTFYFSQLMLHHASKELFLGEAFIMSLLGTSVGTLFLFLTPYFPASIPSMDVGVAVVVIVWILLIRRFYGSGWLETVFVTSVPAIIYVVMVSLVSAFMILLGG